MNLKMNCNRDTLIEAINIVLKAVSSKTTMDILNCILITAEEGGFKLMSNDLEMGIETSLTEADVISPGSVAVEAKLFSDFLRSLPDDEVLIECSDNMLVYIKSGKTEFKLMGRDEKEFPRLADFEEDFVININPFAFKEMVRKTIFSVSSDESRPIFTGELFRIADGSLTIVSADIYRMSQIKSPTEYKNIDDFIVPAKTLNELIRIIPDDEENMTIRMSDTQVFFELSSCKMLSRLIAGDFIDYERVFPKEYNITIKIDRQMLLRCLERASILSKEDKKNPVKISVEGNVMKITSYTGISDFYEELTMEMTGGELTIGFNPRYILEVLRVIDDDFVIIGLLSALSPCVITGESDSSARYMILPLKLREQ